MTHATLVWDERVCISLVLDISKWPKALKTTESCWAIKNWPKGYWEVTDQKATPEHWGINTRRNGHWPKGSWNIVLDQKTTNSLDI